MLTWCVVPDCTGLKKYLGYLLECTLREPYSPVLPGLPHLFYFNLGVLLSRSMKSLAASIKAGEVVDWKRINACWLGVTAVFLVLSYPLMSVWGYNYGNLMVPTRWGMVTRGFVNGPSILWLVGNLFFIDLLLTTAVALHCLSQRRNSMVASALQPVLGELEHLG